MNRETAISLWGVISGALAVQDNDAILDAHRQFNVWFVRQLKEEENEQCK